MGLGALERAEFGRELEENPSLLTRVTSPLVALDAAANLVRSGIGFARTRDPLFSKAFLGTLNPFKKGRRISGNQALGTNFGLVGELGIEILLDPLLPIAGLFGATRAGRAIAKTISLQRELAAVRGIQKTIARTLVPALKEADLALVAARKSGKKLGQQVAEAKQGKIIAFKQAPILNKLAEFDHPNEKIIVAETIFMSLTTKLLKNFKILPSEFTNFIRKSIIVSRNEVMPGSPAGIARMIGPERFRDKIEIFHKIESLTPRMKAIFADNLLENIDEITNPHTKRVLLEFLNPMTKGTILKRRIKDTEKLNKLLTSISSSKIVEARQARVAIFEDRLLADNTLAVTKALVRDSIKEIPTTGIKRSIVKLGVPFTNKGVEFGDFASVKKVLDRFKVFPDIRVIPLVRQIDRLKASIFAVGTSGKALQTTRLSNLKLKLVNLERDLAVLDRGYMPIEVSASVQKRREKLRSFFRSRARDKVQAVGKDLEANRIARELLNSERNRVVLASRRNRLLELGFTDDDIVRGAEYRHLSATPDLSPRTHELLVEDIKKLNKKWVQRFKEVAIANKFKGRVAVAKSEEKLTALEKSIKTRRGRSIETLEQKTVLDEFETDLFEIKARAEKHRQIELVGSKAIKEADFEGMIAINAAINGLENIISVGKPLGVPIEKLTSSNGFLAFVPRLTSKSALAFSKKNPEQFRQLDNAANTTLGASNRRRIYPEMDIPEINKTLREDFGIDFDFFENNIVEIITKRRNEQIRVLNRAKTANVLIDSFGTTNKTSSSVAASKFFKSIGLDPKKAPEKFLPLNIVDDARGADDFWRKQFREKDMGLLGWFADLMTTVNKPFQAFLTGPFPAFHTRNAINNMFVNFIAGIRNPIHYRKIRRIQVLATKGKLTGKDLELFNELVEFRIFRHGQFEEFRNLFGTGKVGTFLERVQDRPFTALFSKEFRQSFEAGKVPQKGSDIGFGRAWGRFLEDNARGAHYIAKRKAGLTKLQAQQSVNKYLFDPTKLGAAEERLLKPTILFYTWTRNNIPLMVKSMITDPRDFSVLAKLIGRDEDASPNWMRGGFAIKTPLGTIASLGLGIEDLYRFNVASADPSANPIASVDEFRRLFEKQVATLSPLLKVPFEFVTGKTSFNRRRFEDQGTLDLILQTLPISRGVTTAESLIKPFTDDDAHWYIAASNALIGVRTYADISTKQARVNKARRELLASGQGRRASQVRAKRNADILGKKLEKRLNKAKRR